MKKLTYTVCLALSGVGLVLSLIVLGATLAGYDPSASYPWLWRLQIPALILWGIMFLVPGILQLGKTPLAQPARRSRGAILFNALLLLIAFINFGLVLAVRGDVSAHSRAEALAQRPLSRLYSLRAYAGFWLVLYGVPISGFLTLLNEPEPVESAES